MHANKAYTKKDQTQKLLSGRILGDTPDLPTQVSVAITA
jgi:hypothetical protein